MNKKMVQVFQRAFFREIQIRIEKSGVKDLKLDVCMYLRRKKMVTEFLMVLSITNFGILCLFFYIIRISVSSVELQDLYILDHTYIIKDMG